MTQITSLADLISQVESGAKPDAVRFEPAYHPDSRAFLPARTARPGLSFLTWETLLACSWGKYQVMGDQLYLLGLKESLVTFAGSETLQDEFFFAFIKARNIFYTLSEVLTDPTKRFNFAHHYNGDGNAYGARMLEIYQAANQPGA